MILLLKILCIIIVYFLVSKQALCKKLEKSVSTTIFRGMNCTVTQMGAKQMLPYRGSLHGPR